MSSQTMVETKVLASVPRDSLWGKKHLRPRFRRLRADMEIDEGNIQKFLKPRNPLDHVEITINLNLAQPALESLQILALETIYILFPELE
ncbi:hypothetical protein CEXT_417751 [Caerostris extrusa]|uniref:Uncharacterized protein n=1 Tax=Caerostris extrusa TaxID=172846 RepID=A0AAV4R5G2_CAEEX|nr:hypothetical protein CEXT_417751 [Caerostris extrusa]